jgi:hypothetical protein
VPAPPAPAPSARPGATFDVRQELTTSAGGVQSCGFCGTPGANEGRPSNNAADNGNGFRLAQSGGAVREDESPLF